MKNLTEKEIQDANKYIAMYMGAKVFGDTVISVDGQTKTHISDFNYHENYGKLMPVVDKINCRDWVTIFSDACKIHSLMIDEFETIDIIEEGCDEVKIPIWKAVSKYCKWFIINNKTNH